MNKVMKKLTLIFTTLLVSCIGYSQQDAMYTHYSFNTLAVNPAYAGSRDVITVTGLHRSQWVGFDGAPTTQTLTIHSPIFTESLGFGASLVNDKIGPIKQTSFYIDLSYKINLSSKTKLSFGLKGGGNLMQGDLNNLETTTANDNAFVNIENQFMPNAGIGLYLFNENWYFGISSPRVLENSLTLSNTVNTLNKEKRHYFFIAGYITKLTNTLKFKPTTYIKATEAAPLEADITAMLIFQDKLELGLMARTGDAVGALIGFNFNSQFRAGYSFDWSFQNTTGLYNSGSHEIMLRYDIVNLKKDKIRSPRYF